jgi:hypothetical protein
MIGKVKVSKDYKQIAPYIIKFDTNRPSLMAFIFSLAEKTNSLMKYAGQDRDGEPLFRVSDPACKMLEEMGMNK